MKNREFRKKQYFNKIELIKQSVTNNNFKTINQLAINIHTDTVLINKLIIAKALIFDSYSNLRWSSKIPNTLTLANTMINLVDNYYENCNSRKLQKNSIIKKKKIPIIKTKWYIRIWKAIWNK